MSLAALLPLLACAPQPPPPPLAARQIIDMQMAARPSYPPAPMTGQEANAIYQHYLGGIGKPSQSGAPSGEQSDRPPAYPGMHDQGPPLQ
jgi:hypothetical protein